MELELTKEQSWISESVDTLLSREWVAPADIVSVSAERRRRTWTALVEFGALSIGDEGGLGAVELCLIARALGSHLASVPFLGSAAVRLALAPQAGSLPAGMGALVSGQDAIGIALLEAGSGWTAERAGTRLAHESHGLEIRGEKVAIEQLQAAGQLAVVATLDGEPAVAVTPADAAGLTRRAQRCLDETVLIGTARFDAVPVSGGGVLGGLQARTVLRHAARRRRGRRRGRPYPRPGLPLRRATPPVRPNHRELPGAAPHPRRRLCPAGERVVRCALRGGGPRRRRSGGCACGIDR